MQEIDYPSPGSLTGTAEEEEGGEWATITLQ
jgi:hypothetical protein